MSRMNHLHLPDHDLSVQISTRNTELPGYIAEHARDRLAKAHRFGIVFDRVDVMLHGERNPRNAAAAHRVEITGHCPGTVVRAEFAAADWLTAFNSCVDRWHERVRRTSERRAARRRGRYGHGTVAELRGIAALEDSTALAASDARMSTFGAELEQVNDEPIHGDHQVGHFIVREKTHHGADLTVEEAIEAMELVGHDFYAFVERVTGQFCVVYQRKAFTYGLLRIQTLAHRS